MKYRLAALAATLSFAAAAAHAAPVNLVVNGGFEATAVGNGSWVNVANIPGWVVQAGPGTGFEVRNNVVGAAHGGNNYIELDTNGNTTIAQLIDGLLPGAGYTLDFWYSPRVGQPASTNGIAVYWNGTLLDSFTANGSNVNVWTERTYQVTAAAGTNRIGFAATGTSDSLGGNLDDVSLTANASTNAVKQLPEPGSLGLLAVALAGVALVRRGQRRVL